MTVSASGTRTRSGTRRTSTPSAGSARVEATAAWHAWGRDVEVVIDAPTAEPTDAVRRARRVLADIELHFGFGNGTLAQIRNGSLAEADAPRAVRAVIARARVARDLTGGAFDPWACPNGLDLSGFVRGWATGALADLLVASGFPHVRVSLGAETAVRGGRADGSAWDVAVVARTNDGDPALDHVVNLHDGSVSISRRRGVDDVIVDPRHRLTGRGDQHRVDVSAVVGPDAGLVDALATALLVDGTDGGRWIRAMKGYSAVLVIAPPLADTLSWGPAFRPVDN